MMTLHGVDIFIRTPQTPELPKTFGPFVLDLISNRGTRVYPTSPSPNMTLIDWPQCRYLSSDEVTDAQVEQLVAHVTDLGWQWTKCQKLFKIDGVDAFSQPY